jgi:hypothetical protein
VAWLLNGFDALNCPAQGRLDAPITGHAWIHAIEFSVRKKPHLGYN